MRILIVGGCGFIGSHIAERFVKEGNEVFIIDRLSTGRRENVTVKHTLYEFDTADKRCEEVFRLYNIDAVIYAAYMEEDAYHCNGIVNILSLAAQYEVKKFLFLSSAGLNEQASSGSVLTGRKIAEECCSLYNGKVAMDIVIARLAHVYGPRQTKGVIAASLDDVLRRQEFIEEDGGAYDFIYVEDAVDAIFRLVQRAQPGDMMNISSNTSQVLGDVGNHLAALASFNRIGRTQVCHQGGGQGKVDNSRCVEELGWRSKYTLETGLKKTYEWHKENLAAGSHDASGENKGGLPKWRPYLENILMFCLMGAAMVSNHYSPVNNAIGIDYNFIYIAVMGLLYGKSQALPAVFLSSVLLMAGFIANGADFVAVLYQVQHMVHFAAYLFFGVLIGYVTDNKDRAYFDLEVNLDNAKERYQFLGKTYLENVEIKERLYKQIVNSDDSIGRTYKIVKKLDTIEVENLFTAATEVAAEMMAARNASIYVMNKNRNYLRLKTKLGMQIGEVPKSIKVADYQYLRDLIADRQIFVNKLLVPGLPDMAAPVVYNEEVIAVIQIYKLKFEDLNLNKQNLLKITSLLIAGALAKAYQYEASVQDKKYIADTRILIPEEFEKIQSEIRHRRENNANEEFAILLKIATQGKAYVKINDILSPLIRDEDFLGVKKDGCVYLLLVNIAFDVVTKVQQRIQGAGLVAEVVDDGVNE